jgi:uncharacterized protein
VGGILMKYENLRALNNISSDIYKKDSVQFNILGLVLAKGFVKLYSDNNHTIICQSNPTTPIWIWTDNTITKDNAVILYDCIFNEFEVNPSSTFIVKPVLYDIIKKIIKDKTGKESSIVTDMIAYQCVEPVEPQNIEGHMEQADLNDLDIIAQYRANDLQEMNKIHSSKEGQLNNSKSLIESGNLYVWRKGDGFITSIAFIAHRSPEHARLNRVYTEPQYRNRGYAAMLMFELSKLILNEGRIPVLYTDASYPASNKAYKKVGFKECGCLYEIGVKS